MNSTPYHHFAWQILRRRDRKCWRNYGRGRFCKLCLHFISQLFRQLVVRRVLQALLDLLNRLLWITEVAAVKTEQESQPGIIRLLVRSSLEGPKLIRVVSNAASA